MNDKDLNDDSAVRKALPEDNEAYAGAVRAVQSWARDGDAPPRIDMALLRTELHARNPGRSGRLRFVWSGAGRLLAAASLCILAMSFGEFRIEWGSFSFQMGGRVPEEEVELLRTQLADIQRRSDLNRSEYSAAIEALSNRTVALENDLEATALKLIQAQEAESATKHGEILSILKITSRNK